MFTKPKTGFEEYLLRLLFGSEGNPLRSTCSVPKTGKNHLISRLLGDPDNKTRQKRAAGPKDSPTWTLENRPKVLLGRLPSKYVQNNRLLHRNVGVPNLSVDPQKGSEKCPVRLAPPSVWILGFVSGFGKQFAAQAFSPAGTWQVESRPVQNSRASNAQQYRKFCSMSKFPQNSLPSLLTCFKVTKLKDWIK